LVAWDKVQRLIKLGGLGILDLEIMSCALQIRWLWLQKTDDKRAWLGLDIPVHNNLIALFAAGLVSHVGNGKSTLFWTDKWINGGGIFNVAPAVLSLVPNRQRSKRTVQEAGLNNAWVADIQGGLSMQALFEYFKLWDLVQGLHLSEVEDSHVWRFSTARGPSSANPTIKPR
jgi:hypothetical protein